MAKTFIQIQAQNSENSKNLDFDGFATQDNITEVLVQSRHRQEIVGQSWTSFDEIIKGDGVNGKTYDIYPGSFKEAGRTTHSNPNSFGGTIEVYNGVSQASVSEIFKYLNPGGSSVKYTRFSYSAIGFDVRKWVYTSGGFISSPNPGTAYNRESGGFSSFHMDIYWGKYAKLYQRSHSSLYEFEASSYEGRSNEDLNALYWNVLTIPLDGFSGEFEFNFDSNLLMPYGMLDRWERPKDLTWEEYAPNPNVPYITKFRPDYDNHGEKYLARAAPKINLNTKEIIGLPIFDRLGSLHNHKLVDHNWTIETDDFATTVTAPTPQEDEVSGTKISQLPSTTTLQDDDLLVISRDEGSDGSFDTSYNTSLSDLAAKMINDMPATSNGWSSGWVNTDGTNSVANGATLTFTHNLGTDDLIFDLYVSSSSSGTNPQSLVNAHQDNTSNIQGAVVTNITNTQITIQLANLGYIDVGSSGAVTERTTFVGKYIKVVVIG